MKTLLFVHGFSASELFLDRAKSELLWVNPTRLVLHTPGAMRLNAAGDGAGAPDGVELHVGNPLTEYVQLMHLLLHVQLQPHGYQVLDFVWDWRQSILAAGVRLADGVLRLSSDDEPATLVGHSAGGLVCRAAWAELVRRGKSQRVRRIITLGSPHFGTYYAVGAWSGLGDLVLQTQAMVQIIAGEFGARLATSVTIFTLEQLLRVVLTWPCLYEMLPLLDAADQVDDPHRPELYTASHWSGVAGHPSALHLEHARTTMRDFLHSAESKPPAHVMTVVSGRGYPTVDRLITPALLGAPAALGKVNEGDGVITRASAEGGFPVVESVVAGHSDLPRVLAMTGRLAKMVLEERAPPDPPPPPVISSTVEPIHLQGPPLPGLSTPVSLILCSGGRCGC